MITKLKVLKQAKGYSYLELALEIGIAETTLYRYLHGRTLMTDTLKKIERYMENK